MCEVDQQQSIERLPQINLISQLLVKLVLFLLLSFTNNYMSQQHVDFLKCFETFLSDLPKFFTADNKAKYQQIKMHQLPYLCDIYK